ncbi:unnamed protein product, partial [Prorocentrum cordatum]
GRAPRPAPPLPDDGHVERQVAGLRGPDHGGLPRGARHAGPRRLSDQGAGPGPAGQAPAPLPGRLPVP